MTMDENIEHFCSYFECQLRKVGRLEIAGEEQSEGDASRYRMVLFVTALDALAGVRYHGNGYGNRQRFVSFVIEHGAWSPAELVSVPFLDDKLESLGRLSGALGQHVSAQLARFPTADNGFLDAAAIDEPSAVLLKLAADETERRAVEHCRHAELLYGYRNHLVHESREPGQAMAVTDSAEPHYTGYIGDPRWYLAYPLAMFEGLLSRSIARLRAYLTTNAVDPYSLIEGADRW